MDKERPRGTGRHTEDCPRHCQDLQRTPAEAQKATFEVLDKKFVFVIDENDKVQQREITVGAELQHLFVVEKGLSLKDKVLLEGIRMVSNGEKIHYQFEKPESVLSHLELYSE